MYKELCNVDLGNDRLPAIPFNQSLYASLLADLRPLGFFEQAPPPRS